MSASGQIAVSGQGRGTLKYKIAAALGAAGALMMFFAVRWESVPYRTAAPVEQRADAKYSRLWIDNGGRVVGTRMQGGKLIIERWGGAPWQIELGSEKAPWALSPDLRRIAWISGATLNARSDDGAKLAVSLKSASALAAGAFSDGSFGAALPDGSILRWDAAGKPLEPFRASLNGADKAVIESDYAALGSTESRTLLLYRLEAGNWKLVQQDRAPDPPFELILPAPGVMAELASGILRIGGETRNTPGAVRSASSDMLDIIASGDFDGVLVLPPQREQYRLANARPGSVLATNHSRLAVSGPDGTSVFSLGTENQLTGRGRAMSSVAILLMGLAVLLAFSGLLLGFAQQVLKVKRVKQAHIPLKLSDPPVELAKSVANEECILWAGAGLSAQSGYPARQVFAAMMMQAAAVEEWIPAPAAQKLQRMCSNGKHEEAINELVRTAPEQRSRVIDFIKATYARFAVPSHTHELIMKLAFPSAMTTNYDSLLEQLRDAWVNNVVALSDKPSGKNFVLKLYGNLRVPRTLSVSGEEFGNVVTKAAMALDVAQRFETRTILFVGCSVEGLLADLKHFQIGATPTRTHYAVVGVEGNAWRGQAETLSKRYGIELLVCDAQQISKALPVFLEKLSDEVSRLNQMARAAGSA